MCGRRAADIDNDPMVGWDRPHAARVPPVVGSIVVIADDSTWRQRTAAFLANEGYLVLVDPSGETAFGLQARAADAALIDLGLTARPATEVCAAWRRQAASPVVAVASACDEATVLGAYAAGADHVAPIDITARQLLAHLRSVLRRSPSRRGPRPEPVVESSPVVLDAERNVVIVLGTKVAVNRQELELLELLTKRAGRVVTRQEIGAALEPGSGSRLAIDSVVRRLREKLESVDGQRRITVVRGVGFRFEVGPAAGAVTGPRVPT